MEKFTKCTRCWAEKKEPCCKTCSENDSFQSHFRPHPTIISVIEEFKATDPNLAELIRETINEDI